MAAIYTLTSIISAFLVFFIQPVVAKIALPTLGGTPAVWSGCMVFFQALLLMGYLYAHVLTGKVAQKLQPAIHLTVLVIALMVFPLVFTRADAIDPVYSPLRWLLTMLFLSVGLPYFAISASSPLLQRWFSQSDHKDAANPYFLYAASNIGSMGSLLLYPFIIEPFATLAQQVHIWETGVKILAVCFLGVACLVWKRNLPAAQQANAEAGRAAAEIAPDWALRLRWLALSFIPSSLLYGVTSYVTTDIASVPLLWIIPLALYLLTFILVFSHRPKGIDLSQKAHIPLLVLLLLLMALRAQTVTLGLAVHVLGLFVIAMSLHGQLSREKPAARYLTEFFLWMSVGGVLGGIFNTLVAPFIFDSITEYPLMLVASALVIHPLKNTRAALMRHLPAMFLAAGVMLAVVLLNFWVMGQANDKAMPDSIVTALSMMTMLLVLLSIFFAFRRMQDNSAVFILFTALMCVGWYHAKYMYSNGSVLYQARSIFGVNRVAQLENNTVHAFFHGTTLHGMQEIEEGKRQNVLTYYSVLPPLVDLADPERKYPIMSVGLGTGTVACIGAKGQPFDFYEIDPLVEKIAETPELFTYMRDCPPDVHVILGDGRQKLSQQPDGKYKVMIMDAFSSDSIPTHLLTLEAMQMYLTKLAPGGVIAYHISNRHIDLKPVISALADELHLAARVRNYSPSEEEKHVAASIWVIMARDEAQLASLSSEGQNGWKPLPKPDKQHYLWRDDFSNVLFSLRFVQSLLGHDEPAAEQK